MFEGPEEKPSQFAPYWIGLVGIGGGVLGVAPGLLLFGEREFQHDTVMIGSFLVGAGVGVGLGWKLFVPRPPTP